MTGARIMIATLTLAALVAGLGACDPGAEGVLPVPALVVAHPEGDPCDLPTAPPGLWASYRKDYYLPTEVYSEPTEAPLDGGRIQVASLSERSCRVSELRIDGRTVEELLADLVIEWYHVWPRELTAGEPVWVAFHSRDPRWDSAREARLEILCPEGSAVDGTFPVQIAPVSITSVTTDADLGRVIIHAENQSPDEQQLEGLELNGRKVLSSDVAAVPSRTLAPGGSAMWTVPTCQRLQPGQAWTVVARFAGSAPSVGAGRVLKPHFPIEAWPSGSECPLPGVNDEVFSTLQVAGIDSLYIYFNAWASCGYDQVEMFTRTLPARGDTYLLLGDDFPYDDPPAERLDDTSAILGFLTGDESDWNIYTEEGTPKPETKARRARILWDIYPELATYNGAMTNKNIGTFAGMTDIQGIDIYAAACAPHIMEFGDPPPLRAPFDYLRNARNNHMPLPTWLYTQGLGNWADQPAPHEIITQAFMVAAAGGKGLMWFQAKKNQADQVPASWEAISQTNRIYRGIREHLRQGDPTGLASADGACLVELIRAPRAMILILINLAVLEAPTDNGCVQAQLGAVEAPHFVLGDQRVALRIPVPRDVAVADIFEVVPTGPRDLQDPLRRRDRELLLSDVALDQRVPVRVFVLAADHEVRGQVASDMTY